ncbi:MAG: ThiF family adenylyltransferase [Candidatus Thorarchaeota archaeon]|jgi:molybdopterin/thiamine biosynthesis adenylyltransferase
MDITIIGLGGIGSILSGRLCRFLNYSKFEEDINVLLVDGDEYEYKNLERQEFERMGNKAEIKAVELEEKYPNINFNSHPEFIINDTINEVIKENNIVLLCVDNHKTRLIVSNYFWTLQNGILISGGNDWIDGSVQIYVRKEGRDLTPDLCLHHPEIANPDDKSPNEMSCEELSKSEPQLYFANLAAASIMCFAFWNVVIQGNVGISEVYFDIEQMSVVPKSRNVRKFMK